MHVAICKLTLHINSSRSLKDKRRVVQAVRDRLSRRFGVSVAEVDTQDAWQLATLGLAAVSGSMTTAESLMDKAIEYVYVVAPEAEVSAAEVELISF